MLVYRSRKGRVLFGLADTQIDKVRAWIEGKGVKVEEAGSPSDPLPLAGNGNGNGNSSGNPAADADADADADARTSGEKEEEKKKKRGGVSMDIPAGLMMWVRVATRKDAIKVSGLRYALRKYLLGDDDTLAIRHHRVSVE